MADYVDWPSYGATYRYWFLDSPSTAAKIEALAGNYMFVKLVSDGWVPIYIGIADDLSDRIPGHERWNEAFALGATKIMAHTQSNTLNRDAEEKSLIGYWNPPLSIQHRQPTKLFGG
jgi:hypothetical protein